MPGSCLSVSVVIPCYNTASFLKETIESVLHQTFIPLEVLVVDDGSTDASSLIAESFGPPVRVIRQQHQGESVARNRGFDEARGDWIAFLDSDDLWDPSKLKLQMEEARRSDVVLIHSGCYYFGDKVGVATSEDCSADGRYELETIINKPVVNTSTAVVRADVPVRFPVWTRCGEDMIFFAELSLHGRFAFVDQPLVGYRRHATQQTLTMAHFERHFYSRWKWVESIEPRIGRQRADEIRRAIRQDVVSQMRMVYWLRNWDKYWYLRNFAHSLDWPEGKPDSINERIYPTVLYKLKDFIDKLFPGTAGVKTKRIS